MSLNHDCLGDHFKDQIRKLTEENARLREALEKIKNELGVPQPGYPQPVANAYEIAKAALEGGSK